MNRSPANQKYDIGGAADAVLTYSNFDWKRPILLFKGKSPHSRQTPHYQPMTKREKMSVQTKFLTTKQLPGTTRLSSSFSEKGRILSYGPNFIRVNPGKRPDKILYRRINVEEWLSDQMCAPTGGANV